MNLQAIVNGVAVLGIVSLGAVAVMGHTPNAGEVALAGVAALGGFIGGLAASKPPSNPSP